jgi:ribonuclease PH
MRNNRATDELRSIRLTRNYLPYAEGSVLIEWGGTSVIIAVSVVKGRPAWLRKKDPSATQGWLTAEYGMLPRATHDRTNREATQGKQSGRTLEIQRLIARSLRAVVDLSKIGDYTITLDCDVIKADGGTRVAAITGGCVALKDAIDYMLKEKYITTSAFTGYIAAVSVGIVNGTALLDLEYTEDSDADTDMNIIMNDKGEFIELQGTAEKRAFTESELQRLLALGKKGIAELLTLQKA